MKLTGYSKKIVNIRLPKDYKTGNLNVKSYEESVTPTSALNLKKRGRNIHIYSSQENGY
jgi:hypothetical protein